MPYYDHSIPENTPCECPIHVIHRRLPRERKLEILANSMVSASLFQWEAMAIVAPLLSVSLAQIADIWEIPKAEILERTVEILEEGLGSSIQETPSMIEKIRFQESLDPSFSELPAHKK